MDFSWPPREPSMHVFQRAGTRDGVARVGVQHVRTPRPHPDDAAGVLRTRFEDRIDGDDCEPPNWGRRKARWSLSVTEVAVSRSWLSCGLRFFLFAHATMASLSCFQCLLTAEWDGRRGAAPDGAGFDGPGAGCRGRHIRGIDFRYRLFLLALGGRPGVGSTR